MCVCVTVYINIFMFVYVSIHAHTKALLRSQDSTQNCSYFFSTNGAETLGKDTW